MPAMAAPLQAWGDAKPVFRLDTNSCDQRRPVMHDPPSHINAFYLRCQATDDQPALTDRRLPPAISSKIALTSTSVKAR
jgi:hypothetical protein